MRDLPLLLAGLSAAWGGAALVRADAILGGTLILAGVAGFLGWLVRGDRSQS